MSAPTRGDSSAGPAQLAPPGPPSKSRYGAGAWIVGVLQFVAAMIVTQFGYGPPTYSVTRNYISDLGAVHCATFGGTGSYSGAYVCSPWHLVFNASIVLLGALLIAGAPLLARALPAPRFHWVGLGLLMAGGVGAAGVGISPEDVNLSAHVAFATLAFAGAGAGAIALGVALALDRRWRGYDVYSILSGSVGLSALGLFVTRNVGALGRGGMERLIVAPELVWAVVLALVVWQRSRSAKSDHPSRGPR